MKAPKVLITANETDFTTAMFRDFLEKKNIAFHLTTPNRHTGNSDIERFHSNFNEHIRLVGNAKKKMTSNNENETYRY